MKQKILIIGDDENQYKKIIRKLDKNKYSFIPKYIDDKNNNFEEIQKALNDNTLKEYVRKKITTNYRQLGVIICDLKLSKVKDYIEVSDIIKFIRNDIDIPEMKMFTKLIPIISYTNYSTVNFAKRTVKSGSNINIQKYSGQHFIEIINASSDVFRESYIDRDVTYIDKLIEDNNIVASILGNIEMLILGNNDDTINK